MEPVRAAKSEPLRVPNEPLRITPPREPEPERVHGAYVPAASAEPKPELVAVPASVFDDDFFRKPNEELRSNAPEPRGWGKEGSRELEPVAAAPKAETHWPEAKVPSFAGYAGGGSSSSDEDELDIPAFLRRSR
jgi:cell division protein FtsZ